VWRVSNGEVGEKVGEKFTVVKEQRSASISQQKHTLVTLMASVNCKVFVGDIYTKQTAKITASYNKSVIPKEKKRKKSIKA
jgi:hypothetical protein